LLAAGAIGLASPFVGAPTSTFLLGDKSLPVLKWQRHSWLLGSGCVLTERQEHLYRHEPMARAICVYCYINEDVVGDVIAFREHRQRGPLVMGVAAAGAAFFGYYCMCLPLLRLGKVSADSGRRRLLLGATLGVCRTVQVIGSARGGQEATDAPARFGETAFETAFILGDLLALQSLAHSLQHALACSAV